MFKQVIFDCDGVLVDTEIVAAQVMVKKLSEQGINITTDHYFKTYTGSTFSGIFRKLLPDLSPDKLTELVNECENAVYERLIPIEGMVEVVNSIVLPTAVVSNSYLWQVNKAITTLGLDESIKHKFSSEMVARPKPAPDVYIHAAKTSGYKPGECLVVEDSKSGVAAAVSAGMTVIGFTGGSHIQPGHAEALIKEGAVKTTSSADELLLVINSLL